MTSPPRIPVLLAPAMAIDHSTSMDLYLENLLDAFAPYQDRFDFEVVTPPGAGGRLGKQWRRYVDYPRVLAARARQKPGAILHVLDHSYGHLCRTRMPSLLSCHGLENFKLPLRYPWHQALWLYRVKSMRFARRVLAISEDVAADVRRYTATAPDHIRLAYYGVDPVFQPAFADAGRAPARLHTADATSTLDKLDSLRHEGQLLVLHVGVNIPRKNIGCLLDALAILRAENLPVKFVKVGSDPRADGYAEQTARLGLDPHLACLGWLRAPELAAVYRACDVLAFPSIHEGFGRPIVEAQACGLPVVVADTDCAREIGGAGIPTHSPTDAADLAARLREVLSDPATRARVVAAGSENVRRFSWAEHVRTLTDLYAQVHRDAFGPAHSGS